MSKASLIKRAQAICFNSDKEPFSLSSWTELTVQQLRTIIVLVNSQMVQLLAQRSRGHAPGAIVSPSTPSLNI